MLHIRFWRILAIVVAAASVVLSLLPDPPEIPGGFQFADKLAHLFAYLVLSFLVFASFFEGKRVGTALITVMIAAALCVVFGGLIEILQIFTGRQPELWDLVADLIGAVCGAFIGAGLLRRFSGKKV